MEMCCIYCNDFCDVITWSRWLSYFLYSLCSEDLDCCWLWTLNRLLTGYWRIYIRSWVRKNIIIAKIINFLKIFLCGVWKKQTIFLVFWEKTAWACHNNNQCLYMMQKSQSQITSLNQCDTDWAFSPQTESKHPNHLAIITFSVFGLGFHN